MSHTYYSILVHCVFSTRERRAIIPKRRTFSWQDGYAAFTIGISQMENTVRYIGNQERHHAKMDFALELKQMLERHGIQPLAGARD